MVSSASSPVRRIDERVVTSLAVQSDGGQGRTRDLSVSGVYFVINGSPDLKDEVAFELELQVGRECLLLKCQGQIVRIEDGDEKTGLGVRIIDSQLFVKPEAA